MNKKKKETFNDPMVVKMYSKVHEKSFHYCSDVLCNGLFINKGFFMKINENSFFLKIRNTKFEKEPKGLTLIPMGSSVRGDKVPVLFVLFCGSVHGGMPPKVSVAPLECCQR